MLPNVKYFKVSLVCISKEKIMSKHTKLFYVFSGIAGFLATAAVFSTIAMLLWNALLPALFGLPVLNWLQAAGLFILCRVLFGGMTSGFRGGTFDRAGRGRAGANLFRNRWDAMSDEQRQHLTEEIKQRHGIDPNGFCGGFRDFGLHQHMRHEQDEKTANGKMDGKKDENESDSKPRND
jgi:hypothetical protein